MLPRRPPSPTIPALTGVRAVFALHVVFFHYALCFPQLPHWVENVRSGGTVGVSAFFVLSGIVLMCNYAGGSIDLRRFYVARVARIYPLYAAALASLLPLAMLMTDPRFSAPAGWASLLGVHTWVPSWALRWNMPGWSVGVELFLYALFPLLVPIVLRICRRVGTANAVLVFWLLGTIGPIAYVLIDPDAGGVPIWTGDGWWISLLQYLPPLRLPEFLVGMAAGALLVEDRRLGRRRPGTLLSLPALALFVAVLAFRDRLPAASLQAGLLAPIFAVLLVGLAHGGILARLFSTRPFLALGKASYGIYLLQFPVAAWWFGLVGRGVGVDPASFLLYLVLLIGVSLASHRWLEEPSRRLLRATLSRA